MEWCWVGALLDLARIGFHGSDEVRLLLDVLGNGPGCHGIILLVDPNDKGLLGQYGLASRVARILTSSLDRNVEEIRSPVCRNAQNESEGLSTFEGRLTVGSDFEVSAALTVQ